MVIIIEISNRIKYLFNSLNLENYFLNYIVNKKGVYFVKIFKIKKIN